MASIHKVSGSPYWHCFFTLPDGRRTHKSTGRKKRGEAMAVCIEYEKASRLGREKRLTESRAREAIADIFAIANSENLPTATVKEALDAWLASKELSVSEGSVTQYKLAAKSFLAFMGAKGSRPADTVTVKDAAAFQAGVAERASIQTANKNVKILRSAFSRAMRLGLIRENPFSNVELMKGGKGTERRAFTQQEVGAILQACDTEWRGIVLFGYYVGQRLGDITRLTWQNVDLEHEELRLITGKTARPMIIPMHPVLLRHLLTLPAPHDPAEPVFPNASRLEVTTLSRNFVGILAGIGLREAPGKHVATGKGRDAKRDKSGVSFHCLRHTATSALKNAGVSDVIAREIIGHETKAMSRVYTHIETKSLRDAVNLLPDLDALAEQQKKEGATKRKQIGAPAPAPLAGMDKKGPQIKKESKA